MSSQEENNNNAKVLNICVCIYIYISLVGFVLYNKGLIHFS